MAYITMNHFRVATDQAEQFEARWRQRRTHLHEVPGFESFRLLRGEESEGAVSLRVARRLDVKGGVRSLDEIGQFRPGS